MGKCVLNSTVFVTDKNCIFTSVLLWCELMLSHNMYSLGIYIRLWLWLVSKWAMWMWHVSDSDRLNCSFQDFDEVFILIWLFPQHLQLSRSESPTRDSLIRALDQLAASCLVLIQVWYIGQNVQKMIPCLDCGKDFPGNTIWNGTEI